jgi:hypothetical protein
MVFLNIVSVVTSRGKITTIYRAYRARGSVVVKALRY